MFDRILVPLDGSATAEAGLREASRLARLTGARLRLVHVLDRFSHASGFETADAYCNQLLPKLRIDARTMLDSARVELEAGGLRVETELIEPEIVEIPESICKTALGWGADLIVIGTHARRGAARLMLGSHAEQILRLARVPVLLVHGDAVHADANPPGGAPAAGRQARIAS